MAQRSKSSKAKRRTSARKKKGTKAKKRKKNEWRSSKLRIRSRIRPVGSGYLNAGRNATELPRRR